MPASGEGCEVRTYLACRSRVDANRQVATAAAPGAAMLWAYCRLPGSQVTSAKTGRTRLKGSATGLPSAANSPGLRDHFGR